VVTNLYTGTPGVVLFFLELAAYTGDDGYLDDARAGADFLLARLDAPATDPTMQSAGLYTGLAGVGFVLNETYVATGDDRFREGAVRAVELIHGQAREAGVGVDWEDSTDIISGGAGTGLFLLYAAREMDHPASLDLAVQAGRHLLEVAEQHPTGLGWRINPEYPRLMPNFSHGTAGVAYFLAVLHEATGDEAFLDAAEAGANRLLSLADTEGDVCLVFHHTDGGEQLQYLSWCHGPAGTARTFYKLWQITGDPAWMEWTEKSANGVYQSGIPDTLTEGFWNNVGQCCGSAGVAEFALAMNEVSLGTAVRGPERNAAAGGTSSTDAARRHLEFAHHTADDLLSRATAAGAGLMWEQAEHRAQPDLLVAQTGYMQGAAGIGMMLLHLDATISGEPSPRIVFPDSPY
jgi:lantibiotic modifying enzyme